jgi:hypothetical protein
VFATVGDWHDQQTDLVDQSCAKHTAIDPAATLEHYRPDIEARRQFLERDLRIDFACAGDEVGHRSVAKKGEILVGNAIGEDGDDMVAVD